MQISLRFLLSLSSPSQSLSFMNSDIGLLDYRFSGGGIQRLQGDIYQMKFGARLNATDQ